VFVSGAARAGKTRWLQARIRTLVTGTPPARCAVVLAEEGRTRWENFVRVVPGVAVHRLFLPCFCCPGLANLPATVHELVASTGAGWLFIEVPAVAAAGIIAEFDRTLGWPRQIVICTTAAWEAAARKAELPFFMSNLIALADTVVASVPETQADGGAPAGGPPENCDL
jgi:hypothetical protein